jgi:hypothetical protein
MGLILSSGWALHRPTGVIAPSYFNVRFDPAANQSNSANPTKKKPFLGRIVRLAKNSAGRET